MKTATLHDLRNALDIYRLAEDAKSQFIDENCDGDTEPDCGYEEYDEAMADFNEWIVDRADDLATVVAVFLDPPAGEAGPAMATTTTTDNKEN